MKLSDLPLVALALGLAACSGKPPAPTAAKPAGDAPPVATPWDGMKKDEQRAKDVQKIVDQQAAEQRKALDAAEH